MKAKISIISVFVMMITTLQVYSQSMKQYKGNGLQISYPATWENMTYPKTAFLFIRPVEEQGQKFRENMNLIISDSKGLGLEEYAAINKLQLPKNLSDYKHIKTSSKTIDNKKCKEIIYTHHSSNLDLYVVYYIFIVDKKAYEFTCSTLQSNVQKYYPVFTKMMSSLRWGSI